MIDYPVKYDSYRANDLRGVAFIMYNYIWKYMEKIKSHDYGSAYGTPIDELVLNYHVKTSISFPTCQYLKANMFTCFATYQHFHDILLSC